MTVSLLTLPVQVTLRTTRVALRATRDVAERGLDALDLLADVLGSVAPEPAEATPPPVRAEPAAADAAPVPPASPPPTVPRPEPAVEYDAPEPPEPVHIDATAEVVETSAEPGAEDGAGAQITIDEPFLGYDALRAADIVARVPGSDPAQRAAVELYERTHRARRTILDALAREARRHPAG